MSLNRITPTTRLLASTFRASPIAAPRILAAPSVHLAQQTRHAATTAKPSTVGMTADESLNLLNKQRSIRPMSPHLTIYQPQLTSILSIGTRITGCGLSVLLYAYGMAYAAAPFLGITQQLSSVYLSSLAAALPFALKLVLKVPIAAAFSFHSYNGVRHLFWDRGYFLSLKGCYQSGYAVLAATALTTVGLCLL